MTRSWPRAALGAATFGLVTVVAYLVLLALAKAFSVDVPVGTPVAHVPLFYRLGQSLLYGAVAGIALGLAFPDEVAARVLGKLPAMTLVIAVVAGLALAWLR